MGERSAKKEVPFFCSVCWCLRVSVTAQCFIASVIAQMQKRSINAAL